MQPRFFSFSILIFMLVLSGCSTPSKNNNTTVTPGGQLVQFNPAMDNSAETLKKPYVILVSIDGYRYDYNQKFQPTNLMKIQQDGVAADSMRPIYPSKTFPNHYTLVTGMTAEHHGIVSNEFFDPARDAVYALGDRKAIEDGTWYFGEPLWITAEKEGMRTASYFWVGSEADILGMHPNEYYRYDESVPYETRVDQSLAWLKESDAKRPHFITLYFEGVDAAAHRYGIGSQQEKDAVQKVDAAIGRLREGINSSGLPINLVVVSDHGMQDLDAKKLIALDETPAAARNLAKFQILGRGPQMLLYLNKGENKNLIAETQKSLAHIAHIHVWRREQMAKFNYSTSPRIGDLVIEPDEPYAVGMRAHMPTTNGANHGWDPVKNKTMHGIFMAVGPAFKQHATLPTFDNINVYPLLLEALDLKQRVSIDGTIGPVRGALK